MTTRSRKILQMALKMNENNEDGSSTNLLELENTSPFEEDYLQYIGESSDEYVPDSEQSEEETPKRKTIKKRKNLDHSMYTMAMFSKVDLNENDNISSVVDDHLQEATSVLTTNRNPQSPVNLNLNNSKELPSEDVENNNTTVTCANLNASIDQISLMQAINRNEGVQSPNPNVSEISQGSPVQYKKGNKRAEMKVKKSHGLKYITRKGVVKAAKICNPLDSCCRLKCVANVCSEVMQKRIFESFYKLGSTIAQDQYLCDSLMIQDKVRTAKGRGKDKHSFKDRLITVNFFIYSEGKKSRICKKLFEAVHGISRGKVNSIIMKKRASHNGIISPDGRGHHDSKNKLIEEREDIKKHIESFPKYESHYSRRHTKKLYLMNGLNIKKMHELYIEKSLKEPNKPPASYKIYSEVFKELGYKFKNPQIDTCRLCDELKIKIKFASNDAKNEISEQLHRHHEVADKAYIAKSLDKQKAKDNPEQRVIVFDMQQCLPTPNLSSNTVFYKRQLWTMNETFRDCSDDKTYCYMWHEALAGRGSDQIASCLYKHLQTIPASVKYLTLYSDTCGGQNRNINMSVMLTSFLAQSDSIQVIDHKFLEPGHTHLECDADHARIERAKKTSGIEIKVPQDWYLFVKMVRGKHPLNVVEMQTENFYSFSHLLTTNLVKRNIDGSRDKVNWFKIRWMRYEREFGIILFKYSVDDNEPFRSLDLRRSRKGRPTSFEVPKTYSGPVPINPLKKKDLLSLLPFIDPVYHPFYNNLLTSNTSEVTLPLNSTDEEDSSS